MSEAKYHTDRGSKQFFEEVERKRYQLEPFIHTYAQFLNWRGKDVLEIGVGLGTDTLQFARAGARITGVDLTHEAVNLTQQRLTQNCFDGDIRQADAEDLPFADNSFDFVYSWGVLHHTPKTEKAVREAIRLLRPQGSLCIMMYSLHSWLSYAIWFRRSLLVGQPAKGLRTIIAEKMESPGTRAFTKNELKIMFSELSDLKVGKVATPYDQKVAGPIAKRTGKSLGWFSVVQGRKI